MKDLAEDIGFEVLPGIADSYGLWGAYIGVQKAVERETGILTEVTPTTGS